MKIFMHGDSSKQFPAMDEIREPYFADKVHDGINIDFLRPWYCELTALYYAVMNCSDDIIGLEQYRRYFLSSDGTNLLSETEIKEILKDANVICAKEWYPNRNGDYIFTWPMHNGMKDKFLKFISCIEKMYGADVGKHFHDFLYGQWHCHGNMIIAKREILKQYLDWLIPTLIEFNKEVKLTPENYRINVYISEFFLGAWLTFNEYRIHWSHWKNCGYFVE